jgi:hypothetical protein
MFCKTYIICILAESAYQDLSESLKIMFIAIRLRKILEFEDFYDLSIARPERVKEPKKTKY